MGKDNTFLWLMLGGVALYLWSRSQSQAGQIVTVTTPSGNLAIPAPGEVYGPPPQMPTYSPGPGMQWQLSPSWPSLPAGQQYVAVPAGTVVS